MSTLTEAPATESGSPAADPLSPIDPENFRNSHYAPALYVHRPKEEAEFRRYLKTSPMIFVYGPWHTGKTWLLAHLFREYKATYGCIYVDCTGSIPDNLAGVTRDIVSKIVHRLQRLDPTLGTIADTVFANLWNANRRAGATDPRSKMLSFLSQTILSEKFTAWRHKGAILAFDHLERIPRSGHEFGEMIRWILNSEPDYGQHLRFVLCSSTAVWAAPAASSVHAPSPLAHGSATITVNDFDPAQIHGLFAAHQVPLDPTELAAIAEWSGGDVGLLRLFLNDEDRATLSVPAWIEQRSPQVVDGYLADIFQAMPTDPAFEQILCSLITMPAGPLNIFDSQARKLKSSWIIRETSEGYFIRSQAYANFIRKLCKKHPK